MTDHFNLRLENLREKSGYTKKEVSKMLGFSANVYGAYERGERRPSIETRAHIKLNEFLKLVKD